MTSLNSSWNLKIELDNYLKSAIILKAKEFNYPSLASPKGKATRFSQLCCECIGLGECQAK